MPAEKTNKPFKGLTEEQMKVIGFDLDYPRSEDDTEDGKWLQKFKDITGCDFNPDDERTKMEELNLDIYYPFKVPQEPYIRFINGGKVFGRYFIFAKLDFARGSMIRTWWEKQGGGPEWAGNWLPEKIAGHTRTDLIIKAIKRDFDTKSGLVKGFELIDLHSMLGHQFDLILVVQAKNENAVAEWVSEYLHFIPEFAHTHTATQVYVEKGDEGDFYVRPQAQPNRMAVAEFFYKNPLAANMNDTDRHKFYLALGKYPEITLPTFNESVAWLNEKGLLSPRTLNCYGANWAIRKAWPIRFVIMIKARGNAGSYCQAGASNDEERNPSHPDSSYQHELIQDIKDLFYKRLTRSKEGKWIRKPNATEGVTLIEIRKLISIEYSLALVVVAVSADCVANFVVKHLHAMPELESTHTAVSLVLQEYKEIRETLEQRWRLAKE
jgi:hypothetical protein